MSSGKAAAQKAVVLSCAGPCLTDTEREFFRNANPHGFILMGRNCETPDQIRKLTADLRASVGRKNAPVLIDQEGGRVVRLKPPDWYAFPPAAAFGALAKRKFSEGVEAARICGRLIGEALYDLGITVDCAPVLDVLTSATHDHVGDRSFGDDPLLVAALGEAVCEGLLAAGVTPVVKHMPAYGRVTKDSHFELPMVTTWYGDMKDRDFVPYKHIAAQDWGAAAWGMPAHALYTDVDDKNPGTLSSRILGDIIRGDIGFNGPLIADDISMKALKGDLGDRARNTVAAGCDLTLYCHGDLTAMEEIVAKTPLLSPESEKRLRHAENRRTLSRKTGADIQALTARMEELLALGDIRKIVQNERDPTTALSGR